MSDYNIWPVFERLPAMEVFQPLALVPRAKFPKVMAWVEKMYQDPVVKECLFSTELHVQYMRKLKGNDIQAPDVGL